VVNNDEQQQDPEARVMHPEGRIDAAAAPAFGEHVRQLLHAGWTKLIIDLDGVSFVDSSGLGAMIVGLKLARRAGGDLRIVSPPQQFKKLLQVTSLGRVLPVYPSIEDALSDFN
jgi:anti-sigma B factor antagonist